MSLDFIKEIGNKIFFIEGQRDGKYPYSHSLLIGKTIIDTGISSGYLRKLKRKYPIENVFLTHWHEDHISGNRLLKKAKFFAHGNDAPVIEDVEKMYNYYYVDDIPEQTELFEMILEGLRLKNTKVNQLISDNQIIETENGFKIKVIHTPGHSAGHCCILELNSGTAFLGDIDLSNFGPWYAAKDSSLGDFEKSIRRMENIDIKLAVTSHKGVVSGKKNIEKSLTKYREVLTQRENKILSFLSQRRELELMDLTEKNIIYSHYSQYEVYEKMAEKVMIHQHLVKLVNEGIIKKENEKFVLN
ncbi:MAG: MBL fold metallo-hydrolase [Promethearchaeia archaeon]